MKEAATFELTGLVIAVERGGNFKVRLQDNGKIVLARCNGHMNKHKN
jgi:translation initiation factor IF-1